MKKIKIGQNDFGKRVDKFGFEVLSLDGEISRSKVQKMIANGEILIDGKMIKRSYVLSDQDCFFEVKNGEILEAKFKPVKMNLDIVFEDVDILLIDKPAGVVVHPGQGNFYIENSLVNGVLEYCDLDELEIGSERRPGVVHRLDKDTSGLILFAKNDFALRNLQKQFKERTVRKIYMAAVVGRFEEVEGIIEGGIKRSSVNRFKMEVSSLGKDAKTGFCVKEERKFDDKIWVSLCEVQLFTGRTHQIRVHFSAIRHPIVGDLLYGDKRVNLFFEEKFEWRRQFLHATKLEFNHVRNGKRVKFESKKWVDIWNKLR